MIRIAETWIAINDFNIDLTQNVHWEIKGLDGLSHERSYLIIANHQTWMDIVVLQHVFNRRIPFIRFFLKHELIYVPFLGWAWWALDFPFMKRHSKKFLQAHPERRNDDLESTLKACRHFKGQAVSVLNFLEGTRFTKQKQRDQDSSFENLLLPKAGGLAFVLNAMGEQFASILDVTIYYPAGAVDLGGALSGKLPKVIVDVQERQIPQHFMKKNYLENADFREEIQNWVRTIWTEKDQLISNIKSDLTKPEVNR